MKEEYLSIDTITRLVELEKENKELKERIDKAIEYIEEYTKDTNFVNGYELLDILKGEEDE